VSLNNRGTIFRFQQGEKVFTHPKGCSPVARPTQAMGTRDSFSRCKAARVWSLELD